MIDRDGRVMHLDTDMGTVEVVPATGALEAIDWLRDEYINAVLLDARCLSRTAWPETRKSVRDVLRRLDDADDIEGRYGFHRIVALVGGDALTAELDSFLAELDSFLAELGGSASATCAGNERTSPRRILNTTRSAPRVSS
ncbi:MAG: hypothetical protein ACJAYU_001690 [Bradymonadia bacterium]